MWCHEIPHIRATHDPISWQSNNNQSIDRHDSIPSTLVIHHMSNIHHVRYHPTHNPNTHMAKELKTGTYSSNPCLQRMDIIGIMITHSHKDFSSFTRNNPISFQISSPYSNIQWIHTFIQNNNNKVTWIKGRLQRDTITFEICIERMILSEIQDSTFSNKDCFPFPIRIFDILSNLHPICR